MKKLIIKCILISLVLTFTLTPLLGCEKDSKNDLYWFRDTNGFFHTNDLKKAQEEIPFTIVLPSYLPEGMGLKILQIYGPREIKTGDILEGIEVHIDYILKEKMILIYENNTGEVVNPTFSLEPKYLDIYGINVLIQKSKIDSTGTDEESIYFDWNQGNLTFDMHIFSISEDEGIKIVESIINQLK